MTINRNDIINRARARYIATGKTKNITTAVNWYLFSQATQEEKAAYTAGGHQLDHIKVILKTKRPNCKECNSPLQLRFNIVDQEGIRFPTAFVCPKCSLVSYMTQTLSELIQAFINED